MASADYYLAALMPEIIMAAGIAVILVLGMMFPRRNPPGYSVIALASLTGALLSLILDMPAGALTLLGPWAAVFRIMIIFGSSLTVFLSHDYLDERGISPSDFYMLVLLATLGMMFTAAARHFLILFLGIELMSLPLIFLTGLTPGTIRPKEAALKYLLTGMAASGMLLYGFSIVYGLTGTWDMTLAGSRLAGAPGPAAATALALILAGLGFKIGLVPFHLWVPDVYDGAPAPAAAFLSFGPKGAAFAAAAAVIVEVMGHRIGYWHPVLWIMAVTSMCWGNLAALNQRNLKRLMAYSGIAQMGYVSIALLSAGRLPQESLSALGFYLFCYLFFNLGFFALIIWAEGERGGPNMEDITGLGRRHPIIAGFFSLFLLALAGIPPTSGFMAKLWVFLAAARAGETALVVIGILNSLVAAFYYLRLVWFLFMLEPDEDARDIVRLNYGYYAVFLAALTTFWFGVWPRPLLDLMRRAVAP